MVFHYKIKRKLKWNSRLPIGLVSPSCLTANNDVRRTEGCLVRSYICCSPLADTFHGAAFGMTLATHELMLCKAWIWGFEACIRKTSFSDLTRKWRDCFFLTNYTFVTFATNNQTWKWQRKAWSWLTYVLLFGCTTRDYYCTDLFRKFPPLKDNRHPCLLTNYS